VGAPRAAVGSTEGSGQIATTARPSARPFVVPTQRDKDQHPVSD
jgi:hypothetical protein